jgi:hypothetical protein
MCEAINKQRAMRLGIIASKQVNPSRKRKVEGSLVLSSEGGIEDIGEPEAEMGGKNEEIEEAEEGGNEENDEAQMNTYAEALIDEAFKSELVSLDPKAPGSLDETLSIQTNERFHVNEECHQMLYQFTRDITNHLQPFPPLEVQQKWNVWSVGKFYVDQSRIILEGVVNSSGLFTGFTFIPGDLVPYEGTIHNVKHGDEDPQYIKEAIKEGYTVLVHQTGFRCYIIGTKGVNGLLLMHSYA